MCGVRLNFGKGGWIDGKSKRAFAAVTQLPDLCYSLLELRRVFTCVASHIGEHAAVKQEMSLH